jgi:hypothetical protein
MKHISSSNQSKTEDDRKTPSRTIGIIERSTIKSQKAFSIRISEDKETKIFKCSSFSKIMMCENYSPDFLTILEKIPSTTSQPPANRQPPTANRQPTAN